MCNYCKTSLQIVWLAFHHTYEQKCTCAHVCACYHIHMDKSTYICAKHENFLIFSTNRSKILIWKQAFASLQHGFLRSEENVLYNFETPEGVWENVSYNILTFIFIKPLFETDVMPQCYIGRCFAWQMLFAIWDVVDVITTEEDVISSYCLWVADVIAYEMW